MFRMYLTHLCFQALKKCMHTDTDTRTGWQELSTCSSLCARALDGGGWDGYVAEVQARRHDILSSIVLTVPGRMRIVCGSRIIAWLEPKGNTYL